MNENIYLTGFMGAGKSVVGRELARLLNRRLVDMDAVLETRLGLTIREYFAQKGEPAFRQQETALLRELSRRKRLVVATGGGLVADDLNRKLMTRSGRVIQLDVSLETCYQRLKPEDVALRPLFQNPTAAKALYEKRRPLYALAEVSLPVDDLPPADLALKLAAALYPPYKFNIKLGETERPVEITWDTLGRLREYTGGRKVMVLRDRNLARLQGPRLAPALENGFMETLRPGENAKSLESAKRLYIKLLDNHFDRGDLLVAMGGGVITDLGAYVAATYKRGLPFVLVSTSLLGCVDAALGGKAAVNLKTAKNAVGCFTVPEAVIMDIPALTTLPVSHIREGLVEAYKAGLVVDPSLVNLIEDQLPALLARDLPTLMNVVYRSARAKSLVVAQDFRESGWRGILNFGHTYGHAVEGFHNYRVSHGRAVAMGMILAARLSLRRGLIDPALDERIGRALRNIAPPRAAWPSAADAWEIMKHDKKIRQGQLVFVLLKGLGLPVLVHDVTKAELAAALAEIGG
jgi:3-dehydroquinate synthase